MLTPLKRNESGLEISTNRSKHSVDIEIDLGNMQPIMQMSPIDWPAVVVMQIRPTTCTRCWTRPCTTTRTAGPRCNSSNNTSSSSNSSNNISSSSSSSSSSNNNNNITQVGRMPGFLPCTAGIETAAAVRSQLHQAQSANTIRFRSDITPIRIAFSWRIQH